MNVHLETDSTLSLDFVFGLLLISLDWERDLHCWKKPNKAIDEALFSSKQNPSDARRILALQCNGLEYFRNRPS